LNKLRPDSNFKQHFYYANSAQHSHYPLTEI